MLRPAIAPGFPAFLRSPAACGVGLALAANLPALARRGVRFGLAVSRSRLLAAAGLLVDGSPGPALGFLLRGAAFLVALGDMFGPALLLARIGRLASPRHRHPPFTHSAVDLNVKEKWATSVP